MLTTKEQGLYDRLIEKTDAGKLKWRMEDAKTFYAELNDGSRKFRVSVQEASIPTAYAPTAIVCLRLNGDYLTSFIAPSDILLATAMSHCEERSRRIERGIRMLDRL